MPTVRLVVLLGLFAAVPGAAAADWFVVPFTGASFGSQTNYIDLDSATERTNVVYGVSGGFIGQGIVGVEIDFCLAPGFFERADPALVTSSRVTTVMGNLVLAPPLSFTREGLRPYLVVGLGLMHAASDDFSDVFTFRRDLLGLTAGGGASGYFTDRVGVRFDVRYLRNVSEPEPGSVGFGPTRLSLWRASIGLALRY
jgi:opacity protein-like surface antigen